MKKILLALLCTMTVFSTSQAQTCDKEKSELTFASALRYNNLAEEYNILKSGCIGPTNKILYMIVNQAQTVDSILVLEKNLGLIDFKILKGDNNTDWLSSLLRKEILKPRTGQVYEKEEKETQMLISQKLGLNRFDYRWKPNQEESNKLLDYVGKKYKNEFNFYKDDYDNFALMYIVVANKPELINYAYGSYQDKSIWIKTNKDKYTPLHFLFSPLLKGKDLSQLNDKVLKEVPVSYIINAPQLSLLDGRIYDYFQFAELMKDNNPDFYKKLKDRYKFKISSLYNRPDIVKAMNNSLSFNPIRN